MLIALCIALALLWTWLAAQLVRMRQRFADAEQRAWWWERSAFVAGKEADRLRVEMIALRKLLAAEREAN